VQWTSPNYEANVACMDKTTSRSLVHTTGYFGETVPSFNSGSMIVGFGPHTNDLGFNGGNIFRQSFNLFDELQRKIMQKENMVHDPMGEREEFGGIGNLLGEHGGFHRRDNEDAELMRLKQDKGVHTLLLLEEESRVHKVRAREQTLENLEIGLITLIVVLLVLIV